MKIVDVSNRFRQAGNRFLGTLNGLQIRALHNLGCRMISKKNASFILEDIENKIEGYSSEKRTLNLSFSGSVVYQLIDAGEGDSPSDER